MHNILCDFVKFDKLLTYAHMHFVKFDKYMHNILCDFVKFDKLFTYAQYIV